MTCIFVFAALILNEVTTSPPDQPSCDIEVRLSGPQESTLPTNNPPQWNTPLGAPLGEINKPSENPLEPGTWWGWFLEVKVRFQNLSLNLGWDAFQLWDANGYSVVNGTRQSINWRNRPDMPPVNKQQLFAEKELFYWIDVPRIRLNESVNEVHTTWTFTYGIFGVAEGGFWGCAASARLRFDYIKGFTKQLTAK